MLLRVCAKADAPILKVAQSLTDFLTRNKQLFLARQVQALLIPKPKSSSDHLYCHMVLSIQVPFWPGINMVDEITFIQTLYGSLVLKPSHNQESFL